MDHHLHVNVLVDCMQFLKTVSMLMFLCCMLDIVLTMSLYEESGNAKESIISYTCWFPCILW